jgi:microcystin-dependent protein
LATSNKNFKVKNGLDVSGAATANSFVKAGGSATQFLKADGSVSEGSAAQVSETAPSSPAEGEVWFNSSNTITYIYYDGFWIEANPSEAGPTGPTGEPGIIISEEEPIDTDVLWLDTDEDGVGIPLGGTAGQVLAKVDSGDFNTEWVDVYSNISESLTFTHDESTSPTPEASISYDPDFGMLSLRADDVSSGVDIRTTNGTISLASEGTGSIYITQAGSGDVALGSQEGNISLMAGEDIILLPTDSGKVYYGTSLVAGNEIAKKATLDSYLGDNTIDGTSGNTVTARISTAVSNLVDSAPAMLDTLNELSAALNDDPNFSTTVATALAALVPSGTINQTARATAPSGYLLCDGSAISRTTYSSLFDAIGTAYGVGDNSTTFNIPNLKGRVPVGFDSSQTEFDTLGETGGAKTHTLTTAEMPSHTHVQNSHNHTQDSHNHTQNSHNHSQNSHNHGQDSHNHSQNAHSHPVGGSGSTLFLVNGSGTNGNINLALGGGAYASSTPQPATATNNATTATNQAATATNIATTATNIATTATNIATTATNQNTGGGGAHNNLQPYVVLNYMIKI